jgi:hypothetical protein
MNIYLIIYFTLNILGLGIVLAKHGEKKEGNHSFFASITAFIISLSLLYFGGCFNNI